MQKLIGKAIFTTALKDVRVTGGDNILHIKLKDVAEGFISITNYCI